MKPITLLLATSATVLGAWAPLASPIGINLLTNPGFELGLAGWTTDHATIRQAGPPPHEGTNYLIGSMDGASTSYTYQVIDLLALGFAPGDLASLPLTVHFGGWQAGWETQTDRGRIEIILSDGTSELLRTDLGWFYSNMTWTLKEGFLALPPSTRTITFGFHALRSSGSNNDGYLDDAFLVVEAQRPVIAAIGNSVSLVTLQITNLQVALSYAVVRSPLLPAESWTERGTFTAGSSSTNWSEWVDPVSEPAAFYRILLKP